MSEFIVWTPHYGAFRFNANGYQDGRWKLLDLLREKWKRLGISPSYEEEQREVGMAKLWSETDNEEK